MANRDTREHQHRGLAERQNTRRGSDQSRLPATGGGFEARSHKEHDAHGQRPVRLAHPLERYCRSIGGQPCKERREAAGFAGWRHVGGQPDMNWLGDQCEHRACPDGQAAAEHQYPR